MKNESHKHFFLGENKQWFPTEEFIVHMAEPRCFIRFVTELGIFASFEDFFESIANVQWIDGRPSEEAVEETLRNAWNFLAIEEEILEEFMDGEEEEPFL